MIRKCFVAIFHHFLLLYILIQTGYKEGVFDGRQSVFQIGFDIGMAEGFRNAFIIGKHQGLSTSYNQIENQNKVPDVMLAKPTRGQCLICSDKQLINKTIPEIIEAQTKHSKSVFNALQKKYAPVTEFLKNSN